MAADNRRRHLWSGIVGGLVAALVVSALPAVADTVGDLVGTQALLSPGDPVQAGRVNEIDKTTWLRGNWANSMLRLVNDGSGPALQLNTQPGSPPLAVDSKNLVKGLNVDRVDNRHANQIVRATGARIGNVDEDLFIDGAADVLTATIDAPAPGLLVMGASVESFSYPLDLYGCKIKLDGVEVLGTFRDVLVHNAPGGDHTNNTEGNCATDGIAMVDVGAHTVTFAIERRELVEFWDASLWVLWVGFDGQGLKPTESSVITLDAPSGDSTARLAKEE